MIDLYYWPTANGIKIPLLLAELDVPFEPKLLNIRTGEHRTEFFAKLNPNGLIPVLVDHQPTGGGAPVTAPVTVFESAAILLYLAEKYDRFFGRDQHARLVTIEWLFWHAAHVPSAFGLYQRFHEQIPQEVPESLKQGALNAVSRLYRVLETRLGEADYLGGEYSIADIAMFSWLQPRRQGQDLAGYPHLARWYASIRSRPAVVRAYDDARLVAPAEKSLADWT